VAAGCRPAGQVWMLQRTWQMFRRADEPSDPEGEAPPDLARVIDMDTWYDRFVVAARSHGRMPYVVEGFFEIWDAVRRGHAVVLVREPATVAEGIEIFAEAAARPVPANVAVGGGTSPGSPAAGDPQPQLVTIRRFDMARARFEVTDPLDAVGEVHLTPKRLQRYLAEPHRAAGVALGA
jgi:hypothetical protein